MIEALEVMQSGWVWWPLLVVTTVALVWYASGLLRWLIVGTPVLVAFSFFAQASPLTVLVVWVIFALGVTLLGVPPIRQQLISDRMFRLMRHSMPSLSETERQALEAGGTGWEAELFSGRPRWRRLRRLGAGSRLTEAERDFLEGPVETFCSMVRDHELNVQGRDLPAEAWDLLRRERFFGMIIPEEYGGLGFAPCAHAAVIMKIASRSVSAALTVMIPNSVGPAKLLLKYGTDDQKKRYLPRLAAGEEIPCFALTGPEAGSDAAAIPDRGVVCRQDHDDQKDVLGIRLNFDKRYISLAPVATLIGVAFKLYDPDRLLGDTERLGITLALVPADSPGVESGERHDPLHMWFHNGPVRGRDVFVPIDAVIGGLEGAGQGWPMLMECLTDGRGISLPALCCATAKMAARLTGAYARIRYQFRVPIARFEGVQEALAVIAGNTFAMEATRHLILAELDEGGQPSVASALVKYNLTDRCRQVLDQAMDIHAGAGIMLGPRNLIGEINKFPPIGVTVEGANILTRSLITFGQGVVRCHPFLRDEIEAASLTGHEGLVRFDKVLARHLRGASSNLVRTVVLGLIGARPSGAGKSGRRRRLTRSLSRLSAGFAFATDVLLLTQRGDLRRQERLSGRMADVLSQLYIVSAASRMYEVSGREEADRLLLEWVVADSFNKAQQALDGVCRNLPGRLTGRILWRLLFPWGKRWAPPADELGRRLSALVSVPSSARDRLTAGIYLPVANDEPLVRLETALGKVAMTAQLEDKLREGSRMELLGEGPFEQRIEAAVQSKLLTPSEAEELFAAEHARREALRVDASLP